MIDGCSFPALGKISHHLTIKYIENHVLFQPMKVHGSQKETLWFLCEWNEDKHQEIIGRVEQRRADHLQDIFEMLSHYYTIPPCNLIFSSLSLVAQKTPPLMKTPVETTQHAFLFLKMNN